MSFTRLQSQVHALHNCHVTSCRVTKVYVFKLYFTGTGLRALTFGFFVVYLGLLEEMMVKLISVTWYNTFTACPDECRTS